MLSAACRPVPIEQATSAYDRTEAEQHGMTLHHRKVVGVESLRGLILGLNEQSWG